MMGCQLRELAEIEITKAYKKRHAFTDKAYVCQVQNQNNSNKGKSQGETRPTRSRTAIWTKHPKEWTYKPVSSTQVQGVKNFVQHQCSGLAPQNFKRRLHRTTTENGGDLQRDQSSSSVEDAPKEGPLKKKVKRKRKQVVGEYISVIKSNWVEGRTNTEDFA